MRYSNRGFALDLRPNLQPSRNSWNCAKRRLQEMWTPKWKLPFVPLAKSKGIGRALLPTKEVHVANMNTVAK